MHVRRKTKIKNKLFKQHTTVFVVTEDHAKTIGNRLYLSNATVWFRPPDGSFEINRSRGCVALWGCWFQKPRIYFGTHFAIVHGIFRLVTCVGNIPWLGQSDASCSWSARIWAVEGIAEHIRDITSLATCSLSGVWHTVHVNWLNSTP